MKSWEVLDSVFDETELFELAASRTYAMRHTYRTPEYLTLLCTNSDHRMLPDAERERLLDRDQPGDR